MIRERRETGKLSHMFTKSLPGGSFPTTALRHAEVQAEYSGPAKLRRLRSEAKAAERAGIFKAVPWRGQSCTEGGHLKDCWGVLLPMNPCLKRGYILHKGKTS